MTMLKNKTIRNIAIAIVMIVCLWIGSAYWHEHDVAVLNAIYEDQSKSAAALSAAQSHLKELQVENEQLKRTAQFYFDQALNWHAEELDTDDTDTAAIVSFKEVVARFPLDPLASAASDRIKKFENRISARAVALQRAQGEVLQLIETCRNASTNLRRINGDSGGLFYGDRFNRMQINWDVYREQQRQAEPYKDTVERSKSKARALLDHVPDPDHSLLKRVDSCASADVD